MIQEIRLGEEILKVSRKYPEIPFDTLSAIAQYFVAWTDKQICTQLLKTMERTKEVQDCDYGINIKDIIEKYDK